jgi:signal transduction histidine kinase
MFGTVDIHSPIDLVPDRSIWDAFDGVVDTEKPRAFQYQLPGERMLWITIVPILSDTNGCVGAVGLFKDATELEKLEKMRNEYVANISHELRTPLTSLRGLLEPLADGMVKDPEAQKRYYAIMLHEVERLSRLITDMLQLSRLQSGTESMEMTMFDVNELLEEVSQSFQTEAKKRNIRIEMETEESLPSVLSDRDRIEQVLVILIDNALRYAKSTIRLRAVNAAHEVVIDVWDDGIGISKDNLSRVFERFYKVDASRKDGGTGLGLSIAKKIMDQLEEQIEVDSVEGEWTCFRFTLKKYVSNAIPLSSVPDVIVPPSENNDHA